MDDRGSSYLLGRRHLLLGSPAALGLFAAARALPAMPRSARGRFFMKPLKFNSPRFSVMADLPIDGDLLTMSDSYPAELPQMAQGGWPVLVTSISATDAAGKPLALNPAGDRGWRLEHPFVGRVRVKYIVDFAIFAKAGWPSPLESAVADDNHVAVCARALCLTTERMAGADVGFELPRSWHVAAPWPHSASSPSVYRARTNTDLTDNFIVFSTRAPDIVTAAGFRMQITSMGHWQPFRALVRRTLQAIVSREVALMGYDQRDAYNVVLVPMEDTGGEAYRQSLVYAFKDPSEANRGAWANTMAHEIFHYWNYARLQGADYASSQWFQEGFTEYVANLTVVGGGIISLEAFLAKLGEHVANYRRLTTTLEAIGTHKGPPLYSAGALVAFSFDVMIRKETAGRRDIGAFFRNLWRYTNGGERKYAWADIEAALRGTAELDWRGFYMMHIRGGVPLPLDTIFHDAGLKLATARDGSPNVSPDPSAKRPQEELWKQLIAQRRDRS